MVAIKISKFLGVAPKISSELLPDTAAQVAHNCKLHSGDLIPYSQPKVVGSTHRSGVVKTLYGLRNPDTQDVVWLSWSTNVSIAIASSISEDEQRFYYAGDGAPKVSNYKLATSGAPPYPVDYYDLGLPVPEDSQQLVVTATPYTPKSVVSFSRDSSNIATITTNTPHGLRTGNYITVSGFTFLTGTYSQTDKTITVTINNHGLSGGAQVYLNFTSGGAASNNYVISSTTTNTFVVTASTSTSTSGSVQLDIRNFNAVSVECTVIDTTTLSYFSPGPAVALSSLSGAKVELGGLTQARSYVFTWYTPWGEESIASRPSANLYIKEGVTVAVSNIPTTKPPGKNFVRGVRLYRTAPSTSGTEYYRLAALWFPTPLAAVSRTNNVARIETAHPHNLTIDDRIKISGCSDPSFNITDAVVTDVIDDYIFEFAQTGSDVSETPVATGSLYYDVAESLDKPPRYWGSGGDYTFTDDFDSRNLFSILETDEYDPPPKGLQGLTVTQNNILVGFVGNKLYFSEPNRPHAWPYRYAVTLEYNIVGIAAVSGALFVATDAYPYIISVADPASGVSVSRVDALLPCLNPGSIVPMNYGVVYSTHDGLAVYSPSSGPAIITKVLYNKDTWGRDVDPKSVVATYYGDAYFAAHAIGAFAFEHDAKIGGFFVTHDYQFSALWYDSVSGSLYYVNDGDSSVYLLDAPGQPLSNQNWKSKVFTTNEVTNLGAARVVADYNNVLGQWETITDDWETIASDWIVATPVTFRLWVDKELIFETVINNNKMFRLPTGYRTDTFEAGVEGSTRVRAIHLAETPSGLKGV